MKLILTTLLAALVAAASLAAVAKSAAAAQTVRVTETSYSIRLSANPKPGTTKFVIKNGSGAFHDFWLKGGGRTWKTRVLTQSGTATLTATLKKGVKYSYWCAVGSHAAKGMRASFVAR